MSVYKWIVELSLGRRVRIHTLMKTTNGKNIKRKHCVKSDFEEISIITDFKVKKNSGRKARSSPRKKSIEKERK